MEERLSAAGGEILAEVRAGVATVTLNRPEALNALTFGMLQALVAWLEAWENDERVDIVMLRGAGDRAFCAGGDIREIHDRVRAGRDMYHFFEVEYALDLRIHTYPKPVVALMDG
ncbi:MAG TPA: enoyl-CoA hydratase/isomerase family protein, partial [Usitatibacter sp.]|nr:enoyl-CoA hydratase/isomerase family protein [Usitatibacter sp.]